MSERDNYYDIICKDRFKTIEDKVDTIDGKVDILNEIVKNGLSHRVTNMNKLLWLLIGAIVVSGVVGQLWP